MADPPLKRSNSISQASVNSQTAQEYIESQLQLEADAREALPYQFDTCTRPLGALRQSLFSCLTCNPPPSDSSAPYTPAGVCYSCSISCHGEHTLVELFNKRNFVCDCGTTRIPSSSPCTLRISAETGTKGNVHSEEPAAGNKYNQNFRNRFCGCQDEYDPHTERGTMFQCLGLGTVDEGGCGEDWWHPECVVGISRDWFKKSNGQTEDANAESKGGDATATEEAKDQNNNPQPAAPAAAADDNPDEDDPPLPPDFPKEDDFEHFICYQCVEAFPWIKRYVNSAGFLGPVYHKPSTPAVGTTEPPTAETPAVSSDTLAPPKKRKAEDDADDDAASQTSKRYKSDGDSTAAASSAPTKPCTYTSLPPAPTGTFSLFVKDDFRDSFCRCATCFPKLQPHRPLLEEEESYEPPLSSDSGAPSAQRSHVISGARSAGTGSLLERGEAALSNVDRVRAIEGVMVYNHLRDKVKAFLQPFAESGQAVGAEDIKKYFEGLRGDAEAIKEAGQSATTENDGSSGGGSGEGANRKDQTGY